MTPIVTQMKLRRHEADFEFIRKKNSKNIKKRQLLAFKGSIKLLNLVEFLILHHLTKRVAERLWERRVCFVNVG